MIPVPANAGLALRAVLSRWSGFIIHRLHAPVVEVERICAEWEGSGTGGDEERYK